MLYSSEVAAGVLRQSIHFLLLQLLRPARRCLLPRVLCLQHQNEPIITRCRKPQQSLKKCDCLQRLLGDSHMALLDFERTRTPPQLLSTATPSQTRALPLFPCSHGCPFISPRLPKEMHPNPNPKAPLHFHSFWLIYLGRAHCREQGECSLALDGRLSTWGLLWPQRN